MKKSVRLSFLKGDWIAVGIVLFCALGIFVLFIPKNPHEQEAVIQIYQDNILVKECALDTEDSFVLEGAYSNTITITDRRVAITESNCPGMDCVHSGFINSMGRSIVCLPNKVEIRIVGESEVDFVVR